MNNRRVQPTQIVGGGGGERPWLIHSTKFSVFKITSGGGAQKKKTAQNFKNEFFKIYKPIWNTTLSS